MFTTWSNNYFPGYPPDISTKQEALQATLFVGSDCSMHVVISSARTLHRSGRGAGLGIE